MTDKFRPPENTFTPKLPGSNRVKTPTQPPVFNQDIADALAAEVSRAEAAEVAAIATAEAASIPIGYLDTDDTLSANSDVKVASQKAVKDYIDDAIAAIPSDDDSPYVTGPVSAVDGNLAVFDGTSGKLIKDGGPPTTGAIAIWALYR